jgi:CHAT domain-containing protein
MRLGAQIGAVIFLLFAVSSISPAAVPGTGQHESPEMEGTVEAEKRLRELTDSIYVLFDLGADPPGRTRMAAEMESILSSVIIRDTLLLSDAYYFVGVQHYQSNLNIKAFDCFRISVSYREQLSVADKRYAGGLANMAVYFFHTGDYIRAKGLGTKALEVKRAISGSDSSGLATNYLNLASINLELNETGRAIELAEAGLKIAQLYPDLVLEKIKADLYHVIGLGLYRSQEYSKSLAYCGEALRMYEEDPVSSVDSRVLMHNTMAQVHRRLGRLSEAEDQFLRGLAIKDGLNTQDKFLLYINYAGFLIRNGREAEGEEVLESGLDKVSSSFGPESREYYMILVSAAEFVYNDPVDRDRSLAIYERCLEYVRTNPWDQSMKKYILSRYATELSEAGRYSEVLDLTDHLASGPVRDTGSAADTATADLISENDMQMLLLRYKALNALAEADGNGELLRKAVATGRRITALYDRQRLGMSEEESRTNLSSSARDVYTGLIDNYAALYVNNGDRESLKGLFEYSERSKVAGFLASMRELNAARFSLPEELTELEAGIRSEIGFYRELITAERLKAVPDSQRLATWESVTFRLLRSRDSLVNVFENDYPAYYNLKFSNDVTPLRDVRKVIGHRANLLSYILTDDKLYIFVANSRKSEVIIRDIDSTFFGLLTRFRRIVSTPPDASGSRAPFNEYMDLAYSLYRVLLEPAEPFLAGDKIVISPDNQLSYLPFETLITEEFRSPGLLYREAPFALKRYRFSYIYSVTLSSETMQRSRSLNNSLIAFAPSYKGVEIDDSLLISWPSLRGEIRELPYAIAEAEDVVSQCGGRSFIGKDAAEGAFKREAKNFKIIHLAMHTLVDDNRPAFSKMLFTTGNGDGEDGMLNTYEVYSLPLKAMMVVLSSCNTGSGMLVNGEGILSLARGFIYAGSRSAVMSLWAVDDISASEVMHSFYRNLRSGQTKSSALRNARLSYLDDALQKRSHPYYWSTLVIYGDDTPLWYNRVKLYTGLLFFMITATLLFALVYRGPRS